jgi:hypothetical protein
MANWRVGERLWATEVQARGPSKASRMMIVRLGFVAEALTAAKESAAHDWVVLKVLLPQEIGSLTS